MGLLAFVRRPLPAARGPGWIAWLLPGTFALLLAAYNNLLFSLPGDLSLPRQ